MKLLKMFASSAHITFNKYIAKKFGVDEAILFGELCSKYEQYTDGEIGTENDEFYCTIENLIDDTCLTEYRIRNAMKNLVAGDLLSIHKKGIPAKNWYKLNENRILDLCDIDVQRTSPIKFNTTRDDKNVITSDDNSNTTIYNKKENKKEIIKNNSVQSTKSSKSKISKKDKILKMVEKKCFEYDIVDDVIDKLFEFYSVLIENNKLVSEQKVNADLSNLAKVNYNKQLQTINEALKRGWTTLEPKWLDNMSTGKSNKNTLIHHEQKIADKNKSNFTFS